MHFGSLKQITMAGLSALTLASAAQAVPLYALSTDNDIFTIDSAAPGSVLSGASVTGLQLNEKIVAIDVRPNTGQLYGVGSSSRLYTINPITGAATAVSGVPFSTPITGVNYDIDFNPTVDLLRLISDADQNLRINPTTGAVVSVDGTLAYTSGPNPNVAGIGYTNNVSGAGTTSLFAIDSGTDALASMVANAGTLTTVGPLGLDVTAVLGFDIYTSGTDTAFAVMQSTSNINSQLYTISLGTGAATAIGQVGGGFVVRDIAAAVPEPTSLAVLGLAAAGVLGRRRRA